MRRFVVCLVLALAVGAIFSFRLGHPALHTDELTYMSKVLESLDQGSALPVDAGGKLFINKPPLALWLVRLSFTILGPSPFAARLPSVLAALATALVLYRLVASLANETVGIAAALVFALVPGPLLEHGLRSATPDAVEVLLVTVAISSLEHWRRRRRPWALVSLVVAATLSAWVKSPFAIVVVLVYFAATELWARRAGRGTPRFAVTLGLVAVAWLAAFLLWLATVAALSPPRTVSRGLFRQQYANRLLGRIAGTHVQGPGYYLGILADDFGPLLLLPLAAALVGFGRRRAPEYGARVLGVWALTAPVLASVSVSKLPWYVYLSYPGMAAWLALGAWRLAAAVSARSWLRASLLTATVIGYAARLPFGRIWPPAPQYQSLVGRFWEVAADHPEVEVVVERGLRFRHTEPGREARFYLRVLLWRQSRLGSSPSSCAVRLVNDAGGEDAVELLGPARGGRGILLIDGCGGALSRQLE